MSEQPKIPPPPDGGTSWLDYMAISWGYMTKEETQHAKAELAALRQELEATKAAHKNVCNNVRFAAGLAKEAQEERDALKWTLEWTKQHHGKTIEDLRKELGRSEACTAKDAELAALKAHVARLEAGIRAVRILINDSCGVSGLHANGDDAPWDELLAGGDFGS